jgi:hypothetical protein
VEDFDRAVALMEEHMRVARDGTLVLDQRALTRAIKAGASKGIEPGTFNELEDALLHTNAALRSDKMVASDVFPSNEIHPWIEATRFTVMGCRGRNGYEDYWWAGEVTWTTAERTRSWMRWGPAPAFAACYLRYRSCYALCQAEWEQST